MFKRTEVIPITLGCLTVLACGTSGQLPANHPATRDHTLTTDATAYVARPMEGLGRRQRYHFVLISRFENRGSKSLYLGRCLPDSDEPLFTVVNGDSTATDRRSGSAYSTVWGCVGHDRQFEIRPGAVRIDTLEVQGPNSFDGRTGEAFGRLEGKLRLYFVVRRAPGEDVPQLPPSESVSNIFSVRVSQ